MSDFLGFNTIKKEDLTQYKEVFKSEQNSINAVRGYYLLFLGIIIEPLLIIIFDIPNIINHDIYYHRTYLYLLLHLLLLSISIFGFFLSKHYRQSNNITGKKLNYYERQAYFIPFIYLACIAFINGLDQQTVESISIYTTFALIIAAFVIDYPKKTAILFGVSHMFFVIGVIIYQPNYDIMIINIINGTIIVLCAYVISILSYISFFTNIKNDFLLQRANEKFKLLSNTDYLTQTYNRRYGMRRLTEQFSLSNRSTIPFGLLLIDLDDFKLVNDKYGHLLGDEALITVVNKIQNNLREEDIVIRYGGEEFLIILPNTTLAGVQKVGEKLVTVIDEHLFDINGHQFNMTISIGGLSYPKFNSEEIIKLLEETDRRLYVSKNSGKNKLTTNK
jgi:diguanylate cyclase (GGDEF)-like protein